MMSGRRMVTRDVAALKVVAVSAPGPMRGVMTPRAAWLVRGVMGVAPVGALG